MLSRYAAVAIFATSVLAVTGCAASPSPDTQESDILPDSVVAPLVAALPTQTVAPLPTARLADGLIPPTNRWFSGLVFGDVSMPVFPSPLSFQLGDGGFALGVPAVTTGADVIFGGFLQALSVDLAADDYIVTAYDEASVTISSTSDGEIIGTTVIAQGSPFVSFTAAADVTATLGTSMKARSGAWTATVDGVEYGLVTDGSVAESGSEITLTKGQTATLFAVAEGGTLDEFVEAAASPIVSTSVTYDVSDTVATTAISYQTRGGGPTIVAAMPHQYGALSEGVVCGDGVWSSIYGTLKACSTGTLSWTSPTLQPAGSLNLDNLSDANASRLTEQLTIDMASTRPAPADTYYGGKWMYRLANMLQVARQVGADATAETITTQLVAAMDEWTDPHGCASREERCFVYDDEAKGLVGLASSFGSEQFNDHHFHYGYFLYTAGVLAANDPSLVEKWSPVINLLAADIASGGGSSYFPERRVFDAYIGHSWASGTSPFADGNNQESSSEAVTAWNGLALWADASMQDGLGQEARWMLSAEAASARAYWTDFDLAEPVYNGFDHTVVSLNWGGKRDYATWFSAEPSAMLGILVLPMSPVSGYLGTDPERVRANIAEAAPKGSDVLFGDYLLMYAALAGPEDATAALEETSNLNEDRIDDGNSRSYLLASIMSRL